MDSPTTRSRYRKSRTLVRGIRRFPKEDRTEYKAKLARLRTYFERFNTDASDLCQWLMGIRPNGRHFGEETRPLWDIFLEPERIGVGVDEKTADVLRVTIFRVIVGWDEQTNLDNLLPDAPLNESIDLAKNHPLTPVAQKLFVRLKGVDNAHLLVLLKSAAEWITARYQRGYDNYISQREEWEKEKIAWETQHPELTPEIREQFNHVFKQLEITRKNPRICFWDRLEGNRDDCEYTGERIRGKQHSQLCKKYDDFLRESGKDRGSINKHFQKNAKDYLRIRNRKRDVPRQKVMEEYIGQNPKAKSWFPDAWIRYLKTIGVTEDTLIRNAGNLPHCLTFGDGCLCNPHTDECRRYRELLCRVDSKTRALESLYRGWRREYLAGPRKPSFRYPSARMLPMPKVFGKNYFDIDFQRSIVKLRLDDMAEGEFVEFCFTPWPKDYYPQPNEAAITSVHVNFIGIKPRLGFRFEVKHRDSRFSVSQDQIDDLRSRVFPRRAQDQQFLDAARDLLLRSLHNDAENTLRVLAVDLGETGAAAALFEGKRFVKSEPLKIIKVDTIKESFRDDAPDESKGKQNDRDRKLEGRKGLSRDHVSKHGTRISEHASRIAEKRNGLREEGLLPSKELEPENQIVTLGFHDLRGLNIHVRRMIRDWVRLNASQIIRVAQREHVDLIVFESLRGFMPPGYDKLDHISVGKKRWLAFFSYGAIRRKVSEKAVERGMRVVTAPYFFSSKVCSTCGRLQEDEKAWRKNKTSCKFVCEHEVCESHNIEMDSDENAARVLARVFWGEILLPTELAVR